jgi:elongation factor G
MDAKNKRSIILLGHSQSGKTTLAENILYRCKATSRKGSVAEGNTVSDYGWDEIERKISINDSFMFCSFQDTRIQIIDSPGYIDFYGEVIAGIRAADNAVVVIDAGEGVQLGTEKAWDSAEELAMPRIIFVNKSDDESIDRNKIIADIKTVLSKKAIALDDGVELTELVAESDDVLLEKYLAAGSLSNEEVNAGLRKAVASAKIFPIIFGSSIKDTGVEGLLEAIKNYFVSPLERPVPELSEGQVTLNLDAAFSGFVFKSIIDPYVGQLSLVRIFSGKLAANSSFYNNTQKISERFGQLYLLQGKEQRQVEQADCGDIVAIPKLKQTHTSDSLCEQAHPVVFKPMVFPEPMMSASVKPRSRLDEDKISQATAKLMAEDPTIKVYRDPETKEEIISGLGDLHLNVAVGRLKKRFNVEVDLGTPKVPYKETVTKAVRMQGKYKRQSGGRGQYGDVWIEVRPLEPGKGFEFVDKVFGGAIPRNFIPSVEKGVRQAMSEGVVAGYPVVDLQVVLQDGSYHEVDSSDMAFQIAGSMALRKATMEAHPALLEPVMEVEVYIPEEFVGQVSGDLNSRRGRPLGMEVKSKTNIVKAQVPLAEMFTYGNDLRSMTQGKGTFSMKFLHYEQVPAKIANNIISKYQAQQKKEEQV